MDLSALLRRLGDVAPTAMRGAIVGAASPTRGAVGTAGDFFGSMMAADDDRMQREREMMQREMAMQEAKRRQRESEARLRGEEADIAARNAQEAMWRAQAQKAERYDDPAAGVKAKIALFEQQVGRKATEREIQTLVGTHGPVYDQRTSGTAAAPPKSFQELLSRRTAEELAQYDEDPYLDPTGERETFLLDRLQKAAGGTAAKPQLPFGRPTIVGGADDSYAVQTELDESGKLKGVSKFPVGAGRPKRAETRPQTQIIQDENGEYHVVNKGQMGPTGIKKPKQDSGAAAVIKEWLGGGNAAPSNPATSPKRPSKSAKVGDRVRVRGNIVTVTKVNPDGTFEFK